MTKSFKTKANYSAKDLTSMKKRFAIFTLLFPIMLGLVVVENFFTSNQSWKVAVVEFVVEWYQVAKLLFGGKAYDYSIEIANYSFKVDAKRFKFDVDIASAIADKFDRYGFYFGRKTSSLSYNQHDKHFSIEQHGKDNFTLYYDNGEWTRFKLTSQYQMTKEQVLVLIKHCEKIKL